MSATQGRRATAMEQAAALKTAWLRLRGKTDGCTLSPDLDFKDCCDMHDVRYRANPERITRGEADVALFVCIRSKGYLILPLVYWAFVRLVGWAFWKANNQEELV